LVVATPQENVRGGNGTLIYAVAISRGRVHLLVLLPDDIVKEFEGFDRVWMRFVKK